MRFGKILVMSGVALLAGCVSVGPPRATVMDGVIENRALGFFGFRFKIPEGYALYNPGVKNESEYNELQRMAIRIYDLNRTWHPRDAETFYESFLLMSEKTCFLLMTIKSDSMMARPDASPFSARPVVSAARWEPMPFYNTVESRPFELGENRQPALYARGTAYERDGWHYPEPKSNRMPFSYEGCRVSGNSRDSYVLIGVALPADAATLTAPMRQMINGMEL